MKKFKNDPDKFKLTKVDGKSVTAVVNELNFQGDKFLNFDQKKLKKIYYRKNYEKM